MMHKREYLAHHSMKQYILTSYRELLKTHAPDKISVKQIATHAGVNRSTFYLHFQDKYEVLQLITEEKLAQLVSYYYGTTESDDDPKNVTIQICTHIYQNKTFYKELCQDDAFKDRLFHYLYEALFIHIQHEAIATFTAYGTMGYFIEWIKQDCQKPIDIIASDLASISNAQSVISKM